MNELAVKLCSEQSLSLDEYERLIKSRTPELAEKLAKEAAALRKNIYGNDVYVRGLIEISSYCKNDCFYCGIRRSNREAERYRLTTEEILACCDEGYELGFRTFVLQGGEDGYFTDELLFGLIRDIKERHPDCAVTLSLGERGYDSFRRLYDAGADRYLLRHETATKNHYEQLHPSFMSFEHRMKCLQDLKELGYQTGAGMMIGAPFASSDTLAADMEFLGRFKPQMVGTGPFLSHKDTPFRVCPKGSYELTLFVLSLVRIMLPNVLLPATTALGTIRPNGREQGVLHGANVIMPNLSPTAVRKKYMLYDNKICTEDSTSECRFCLQRRMESIGYNIEISRGDFCND